jgi:hypothetical protein
MSVFQRMLCLLFLIGLMSSWADASAQAQNAAPTDHWHLAMVGDVMLGSDYPASSLPPREGRGLLDAAAPYLKSADLAIGNLEGTIGAGGHSAKVGCARCYVFRTPADIAPRLKEAGFKAFSQANNHAHDFGADGFVRTGHVLDEMGLAHAGGQGAPLTRIKIKGRNACLLAFAPNMGMNDLRYIPRAVTMVHQARGMCDLIVVAFHGGAEGPNQTHTPMGVQMYLGENRGDVRRFAHAVVDAGADVVFGQGPHVARGMETYRGHLIAYSLGNFMTYGGISVAGDLGWAPLLKVELDGQGRLVHGDVVSFIQSPHEPLRLDPEHRAAKLIAQRSEEDFGADLAFSTDGRFQPLEQNTLMTAQNVSEVTPQH